MVSFIPVANEALLKEHGIFYKPTTLRLWHCTGKHPHLFKKILGRIHVDLQAWHQFVAEQTGK